MAADFYLHVGDCSNYLTVVIFTVHSSPVSGGIAIVYKVLHIFSVPGVEVSARPSCLSDRGGTTTERRRDQQVARPGTAWTWLGSAAWWWPGPDQTGGSLETSSGNWVPPAPASQAARQKVRKTEILLEIMYYILKLVTAPTPALPGKNTQIVL